MIRRIVYRHTRGDYAGLRQILALADEDTNLLTYLHTGEARMLERGPLPDKLAPVALPFDGRIGRGMRLKTSDKYVMYQEVE
jgi:hypothetical protein